MQKNCKVINKQKIFAVKTYGGKIMNCETKNIGTWGQLIDRTCSDRVKKGIGRCGSAKPSICVEHARAEMKAYEQYKDEPRVIQRARVFETYLRDKSIFIYPDELLVGNITSSIRNSPFVGELYYNFVSNELD